MSWKFNNRGEQKEAPKPVNYVALITSDWNKLHKILERFPECEKEIEELRMKVFRFKGTEV